MEIVDKKRKKKERKKEKKSTKKSKIHNNINYKTKCDTESTSDELVSLSVVALAATNSRASATNRRVRDIPLAASMSEVCQLRWG